MLYHWQSKDILDHSVYLSRWSKTTNSRKESLKSFTAIPYYTHLFFLACFTYLFSFYILFYNLTYIVVGIFVFNSPNLIITNDQKYRKVLSWLWKSKGTHGIQHRRLKAFFHPISTRLNYTLHNKNNQGITISQKKNETEITEKVYKWIDEKKQNVQNKLRELIAGERDYFQHFSNKVEHPPPRNHINCLVLKKGKQSSRMYLHCLI